MRNQRVLSFALLCSLALHLLSLLSPGPESLLDDIPPGEALRLSARVSASVPPPLARPPQPKPSRPAPPQEAPAVILPALPGESAAALPPPSEALPEVESLPPADSASAPPALAESAPASEPEVRVFNSERLPQQGRVLYSGSAGGVIALSATGLVSWEHDGKRFESRLAAGLSGPDTALDFRSTGRIVDRQLISEASSDQRMRKHSTSLIDQQAGLVLMQRGEDKRERQFKGLAVALSALPQLLIALDDRVEKAAFFVVGDFWVEDSLLIARGPGTQNLPVGRVETRHYQSRSYTGKLVDVWLAPGWRNAPVRIRIESDGFVLDLKASLVEIEGQELVREPEA